MTKEEFLSGARFYNAVRGRPSDWAFVKSGRIYPRRFVENMPQDATSPLVIESIEDGWVHCSNLFWERNELIKLEELELVPSAVEQDLFESLNKAC